MPKGSGDPIAGPALEIENSILEGFYNSGPDGVTVSPATGVITFGWRRGGLALPIVYVSPGSSGLPLEIGVYR